MSTLTITDLHVTVETENGPLEILRGVDMVINSGETHAVMGPNGSGKSTLAYTIAGHPKEDCWAARFHSFPSRGGFRTLRGGSCGKRSQGFAKPWDLDPFGHPLLPSRHVRLHPQQRNL
jgi:ABC-type phosphonate transport system ATPase subunit